MIKRPWYHVIGGKNGAALRQPLICSVHCSFMASVLWLDNYLIGIHQAQFRLGLFLDELLGL